MVAITIIAAAVAVAVAVAIKAIAINTIAVAATIAVWFASKKAVVLDVLLLAINGNSNSCGNHPMIVVIS